MLPSILEEEVVVPFSLYDSYYGMWEAKGLAKASEKGLFLEFEIKEVLMHSLHSGLLKSGVQEVFVPLDEIEEIVFKTSALSSNLIVKTKNLKTLSDVPGNHVGGTKLGISRGHREGAQRLVSTLMMYHSEKQLKEAEERLKSASENQ